MAEQVFKKITELDTLSGSLDGSETLPVVKAGKTYRRSWSAFFGSGWAANLFQAFTAFKSPDSVHADDADTVEGQDAAMLHNAALLTGNIHLDRIPAELTGKNAATATKLATARTIGGVSFDGTANINLPGVNTAGNQDTTGNAATATDAASCSGNAATATTATVANAVARSGFVSGHEIPSNVNQCVFVTISGDGAFDGIGIGYGGMSLPSSVANFIYISISK